MTFYFYCINVLIGKFCLFQPAEGCNMLALAAGQSSCIVGQPYPHCFLCCYFQAPAKNHRHGCLYLWLVKVLCVQYMIGREQIGPGQYQCFQWISCNPCLCKKSEICSIRSEIYFFCLFSWCYSTIQPLYQQKNAKSRVLMSKLTFYHELPHCIELNSHYCFPEFCPNL